MMNVAGQVMKQGAKKKLNAHDSLSRSALKTAISARHAVTAVGAVTSAKWDQPNLLFQASNN